MFEFHELCVFLFKRHVIERRKRQTLKTLDIWAFLKLLKYVLNLSYLRNLLNFKKLSL